MDGNAYWTAQNNMNHPLIYIRPELEQLRQLVAGAWKID
jgi:hypothetical protein